MALFHLTLNPWQQSCLDHTARTGTRAMAVSVLHAQASAMQQQIVFIQTTYLKNKSGVTFGQCQTILRDNTSSLEIQARLKKYRLH